MKIKESDIQVEIVEYLSMVSMRNNFIFFSIPNESLLYAGEGKNNYGKLNKLKRMGLTPGVADLQIIKDGKCYFLEVKRPGGKLSENQEVFRDNVRRIRGDYKIVYCIDDVIEILIYWNVINV